MAESVFTATERPIDALVIKSHDILGSKTIAANGSYVTTNDDYATITYTDSAGGKFIPVAIVGWQLNGTGYQNCVLTYVRFGTRDTNTAQVHFCIRNFASSSVSLTSVNLRVLWCKQ